MLWQFFSLPGIENGIEYRYFQGIVSKLEIPVSWQHYYKAVIHFSLLPYFNSLLR